MLLLLLQRLQCSLELLLLLKNRLLLFSQLVLCHW